MQLNAQAVEVWMTRIEAALSESFCLTTARSHFLRQMRTRMQMSAQGLCITHSQMESLERYVGMVPAD